MVAGINWKDVAAPAMWDETRGTCAWACQLLLPLTFGAELINSQSGGLGALGYQAFPLCKLVPIDVTGCALHRSGPPSDIARFSPDCPHSNLKQNNTMKSKTTIFVLLLALVAGGIWLARRDRGITDGAEEKGLVTVRFANLPYADHTITSIGAGKGFFKEAGIDLQLETIKVEEAIPSLVNGKFDVISAFRRELSSVVLDSASNVIAFVFSDLFQGYALMAQPNSGYKSYADFVSEGKSHSEAIVATMQQVRGKTFAYPAETAIRPFIDKLLADGSMSASDYKPSRA